MRHEDVVYAEGVAQVVLLVLVTVGLLQARVVTEEDLVEPLHVHHRLSPLTRPLVLLSVRPAQSNKPYRLNSAKISSLVEDNGAVFAVEHAAAPVVVQSCLVKIRMHLVPL